MRNDDLNETVTRLRGEGLTFLEIAQELGTTRSAIAGRCARLGLSATTPRSYTGERDAQIVALIESGLRNSDVAQRLGISESTVSAVSVRAQVVRPRREIVRAPRIKPVVVKKVEPAPVPAQAPDASNNVVFIEARGCRFALWSDAETELDRKHVCGARKQRGAYCAFHAALAYRTPESRRAA